ncbi:MAG: hypothetical protein F8N37_12690 [Telmatospirillum sp.]|nr:hypothetical protein [Telmatospirillum sp.]
MSYPAKGNDRMLPYWKYVGNKIRQRWAKFTPTPFLQLTPFLQFIRNSALGSMLAVVIALSGCVVPAAGRDTTEMLGGSSGSRPIELTMTSLPKSINAVDLRGYGHNDDFAIKLYFDSGTITSPTVYIFMTRAENDSASDFYPVTMPKISGDGEFYTLNFFNGDCFGVASELMFSPNRKTFLIIAKRKQPYGKSIINISFLRLVEDAESKTFSFVTEETHNVESSACTEEELIDLESIVLGIKINGKKNG